MTDPTLFNPSPEQTGQLINELLSPSSSLLDIAHQFNTTVETLTIWMTRPEIQQRLDNFESAVARRVRAVAINTLPSAIDALGYIIAAANYTESNIPLKPGSTQAAEQRRRDRETTRRACSLLGRLAKFFPANAPSPQVCHRSPVLGRSGDGNVNGDKTVSRDGNVNQESPLSPLSPHSPPSHLSPLAPLRAPEPPRDASPANDPAADNTPDLAAISLVLQSLRAAASPSPAQNTAPLTPPDPVAAPADQHLPQPDSSPDPATISDPVVSAPSPGNSPSRPRTTDHALPEDHADPDDQLHHATMSSRSGDLLAEPALSHADAGWS